MKNLMILGMLLLFNIVWGQNDSSNDSWESNYGNVTTTEKVGIGTTSPRAKLDIFSSEYNLALFRGNNMNGLYQDRFNRVIVRNRNGQQSWIGIEGTLNNAIGYIGIEHWQDPSPQIALAWNKNGNVGIGTTSPQYKLDINGTARAKEILVEEGWGDYVFLPNYHRLTLAEESRFIQQNGHLSGFQSAKEMNGEIQLGDVTKRQQVKIEEMMLYMIEMNERLGQLETENEKLKSQRNKKSN